MALVVAETSIGTGTTSAGAVTINALSGYITTQALTTAAGATFDIDMTNSKISTNDIVVCNVFRASCSAGEPVITTVFVLGTSCAIRIQNIHAANAFNGTLIIGFFVIKGSH